MDASTRPASERVGEKTAALGTGKDGDAPTREFRPLTADAMRRGAPFS